MTNQVVAAATSVKQGMGRALVGFLTLSLLAGCGAAAEGDSGSERATASQSGAVTAGSVLVNAGGAAVSPFLADQFFSGGSPLSHANVIDTSHAAGAAPAAVYQTARTGNFSYKLTGFAAGASRTVRLHFAETYFSAPGSRVFDVSINGAVVLSNFDIIARAGAKNRAYVAEVAAVADSNGTILIQFRSVKDASLVSALEITTPTADQLPWRPLNVTAVPGQHVHTVFGSSVGLDNRSAKMAGKLVVDLGVNAGGYQTYLGKRGFHVFGVTTAACTSINDWTLGRDYDGDCRLNTLDGLPHGSQASVLPADSVIAKVTNGLTQLQQQFPAEDWGYFLNQDGSVRWSDVAFTGFSHGATSAAVFAHARRASRVVSFSGPRDDTCGLGAASGDFNQNAPPYDPNCPLAHIASWLDSTSQTPLDRYYAFAGKLDATYGDVLFAMDRLHLLGSPVNVSTTPAPYGGSQRFYADVGHAALSGFPPDAVDTAFGVLPENRNPSF